MALRGFYGACRCIWCGVGVVGVWWGVSIIKGWGNSKANLLKKPKKNLTRELKKPILALRGSEKFYEKIKKFIFISIGEFKFEWMWRK